MTMKNIRMILPVILSAIMMSSCAGQQTAAPSSQAQTTAPETQAAETEAPVTEPEEELPEGAAYADLSKGMPQNFEASDGWTNGSMFNVTWRAKNVTFDDGKMQLIIDKDSAPKAGIPYSGGEFRSKDFYGYGLYEVSMKAIKNDGVVSSFFTYTGPSDNNPWDEIDVEILGKDTTKVQFNYFTDGKGGHEYMHELGFDASEDFHVYGFEWTENSIKWFVDGEEVHSAEKKIPTTPGKIMMNAWCGTGVDGWLNAFDDSKLPIQAEYEWVRFTPAQ